MVYAPLFNGHHTIFVSVTRIEQELRQYGVTNLLPHQYAYGNWKLGRQLAKAGQCEWLAAVRKGIVIGVWGIDRSYGWQPMTQGMNPRVNEPIDPERKQCRLLPMPELPDVTTRNLIGSQARLYFSFGFNF